MVVRLLPVRKAKARSGKSKFKSKKVMVTANAQARHRQSQICLLTLVGQAKIYDGKLFSILLLHGYSISIEVSIFVIPCLSTGISFDTICQISLSSMPKYSCTSI